ncbi:hypothetical protein H5410_003977 [Solanum commersonii]|uniref:Uncharacterized protein n=1 Tax=Solanum commersonii TaxID=4109 RepID=A0A9J6B6R7_SOLCO|nr:hypothetical protein H5410_003977 [Solanum commersonii]
MFVQFYSGAYLWIQEMPLFQEAYVNIVTVPSQAKGNSNIVKVDVYLGWTMELTQNVLSLWISN